MHCLPIVRTLPAAYYSTHWLPPDESTEPLVTGPYITMQGQLVSHTVTCNLRESQSGEAASHSVLSTVNDTYLINGQSNAIYPKLHCSLLIKQLALNSSM
jgi:hypothetical protein